MATKNYQRPPEDDWAGLAQNLFGINLDKDSSDDDLLNEDLFQVEIPKPPEPEPPAPAAVETPAPVVSAPAPQVTAESPAAATPRKSPAKRKPVVSDDPFGAGILEDVPVAEEEVAEDEVADEDDGLAYAEDVDDGLTLADETDDGLTLPPDHDAEGLTLPPDYDDGLTLAQELESEDEEEPAVAERAEGERRGPRGERPRRRFRKREDAYWDLLENFDWQEITDSDEPRSGDRSGGRRGDRGPRRGRDRDRGDDRSRRDRTGSGGRSRSASEAPSDEPRRSEAPRGERSDSRRRSRESGESGRDRDRPRERGDRDSGGRPRREEGGRREPPRREPKPVRPNESLTSLGDELMDDFAFGIFEEEQRGYEPPSSESTIIEADDFVEDVRGELAPSAETDDEVIEAPVSGMTDDDDLVWDNDDSDVRLTPANRELERLPVESESLPESEQAALPAADRWDESEEQSDVRPLPSDEDGRRRRRRRRRRRGGEPARAEEGTVFDLTDVLAGEGESPDQVPDAELADAVEDESLGERPRDRDDDRDERRGRRRRRRRRPESGDRPQVVDDGFGSGVDSESQPSEVLVEREPEEEVELPQINYGAVPSWEEAIRFLLNPHLVGRNLGPEDEQLSLEGDPRGSGGSEPVGAPPPQRRFRRGGRGRRPPQQRS